MWQPVRIEFSRNVLPVYLVKDIRSTQEELSENDVQSFFKTLAGIGQLLRKINIHAFSLLFSPFYLNFLFISSKQNNKKKIPVRFGATLTNQTSTFQRLVSIINDWLHSLSCLTRIDRFTSTTPNSSLLPIFQQNLNGVLFPPFFNFMCLFFAFPINISPPSHLFLQFHSSLFSSTKSIYTFFSFFFNYFVLIFLSFVSFII